MFGVIAKVAGAAVREKLTGTLSFKSEATFWVSANVPQFCPLTPNVPWGNAFWLQTTALPPWKLVEKSADGMEVPLADGIVENQL